MQEKMESKVVSEIKLEGIVYKNVTIYNEPTRYVIYPKDMSDRRGGCPPQCMIVDKKTGTILCKYPNKPLYFKHGMRIDTTKYTVYPVDDGTIINLYCDVPQPAQAPATKVVPAGDVLGAPEKEVKGETVYPPQLMQGCGAAGLTSEKGMGVKGETVDLSCLASFANREAICKKEAPAWHVATAHGCEMDAVKWLGDMTYMEIVKKLFADAHITFADLDPGCSYALGITWQAWHPFGANKDKVWFVSSWDRKTGKFSYEAPAWAASISKPPVNIDVSTLEQICNKSYVRYMSGEQKADGAAGVARAAPVFGYIFRAKTASAASGQPDILMESELMRSIRKMFYDHAKGMSVPALVLRSFLYSPDVARKLFPTFAESYARYDKMFKSIASHVVAGTEPIDQTEHNLLLAVGRPRVSNVKDAFEMLVSGAYFNAYANVLKISLASPHAI